MSVRLDKIVVYHEIDTSPDLSDLGTYSETPGPDDKTIDRRAISLTREAQRIERENEFPYFIAALSGEETGNPDSVHQDYQRMESYNRQEWYMLGIYVVATVSYDIGNGSRRLESLRSGGLWEIESDCGDEQISEFERDELDDLKAHCAQFGIDVSEFDSLAEKADRREK